MTRLAPPPAAPHPAREVSPDPAVPLYGWEELREMDDIQFQPIEIPPPEPEQPGWFDEALRALFGFLGDLLAPVGRLIAGSWPVLQWLLLALAIAFALYLVARLVGPFARNRSQTRAAEGEPDWAPTHDESLALLEDADRLAAQGRFDEATHLLMIRSVSHIASARPDWVEPSSTARELAALPHLSDAARTAFTTIAQKVERSLFALGRLEKHDWDAARAAYAQFVQGRIGDAA